jgi:hypothetical protein
MVPGPTNIMRQAPACTTARVGSGHSLRAATASTVPSISADSRSDRGDMPPTAATTNIAPNTRSMTIQCHRRSRFVSGGRSSSDMLPTISRRSRPYIGMWSIIPEMYAAAVPPVVYGAGGTARSRLRPDAARPARRAPWRS